MRVILPSLAIPALLACPAAGQDPGGVVARIDEILEARPLGDAAFRHDEIGRNPGSSIHLVQVREEMARHFHERHDETVFLYRGSGVLVVGDREMEIAAGTVMLIPRGTPHAFASRGDAPAVALVVYSPAFDGTDRVPLAAEEVPRPPINALLARFVDGVRDFDEAKIASCLLEEAGPPAEVARAFADPGSAVVLECLARFPLVSDVPETCVDLWIEIEAGRAPDAARVRVRVAKTRGELRIADFRFKPIETDPDGEAAEARRARILEDLRPEDLSNADAADLREALLAHFAAHPEEGVPPPFPSVRGLWPGATRVRVYLEREPRRRFSVEFARAAGGWSVDRIEIRSKD